MNTHFMKKLPPGAETSNILVGELNNLDKPISCFIRLQEASMLGDLTEVPVPTRFIFILLGPGVSEDVLQFRLKILVFKLIFNSEFFQRISQLNFIGRRQN